MVASVSRYIYQARPVSMKSRNSMLILRLAAEGSQRKWIKLIIVVSCGWESSTLAKMVNT